MTKVIVIGDGPAGLSAALFMAKNGLDVTVFGQDETAMNYALLFNYLGIPKIPGPEFQQIARQQVSGFGAALDSSKIASLEPAAAGFTAVTEDGARHEAKYVVLAEGRGRALAKTLGLKESDLGVEIDLNGRTSYDGIYAAGRMTRVNRSQAIISAGQGAAAALDILAREAGKDVKDWDSPPKEE